MEQYKQAVEEYMQERKPFHVYSEVVGNKLILPKKEKYTKKEYNALRNFGFTHVEARFICLCSAAHYKTNCSSFLHQ